MRPFKAVGIGLPTLFANTQHCAVLQRLEFEYHQHFVRLAQCFFPFPGIKCEFNQFVLNNLSDDDGVFAIVIPSPCNLGAFRQIAARAIYKVVTQLLAGYDRVKHIRDRS